MYGGILFGWLLGLLYTSLHLDLTLLTQKPEKEIRVGVNVH